MTRSISGDVRTGGVEVGKTRPMRRILALAAVGAAVATMAPTTATATVDASAARLAGSNRYATAAAVATTAFSKGATATVLVSGTNFPDGLAAAALAGAVDGPILLTEPGKLPIETEKALSKMATGKTVWVIGGEAAIGRTVRDRLKALGYRLQELSGPDRYATATAVAAKVAELKGIGSLRIDGRLRRTAGLVTGADFPDALSAGPLAASARIPILLTTGTALHPTTEAALKSLKIEHVVTIGGRSVVTRDVTRRVEQLGMTVERISGADRAETAAAVADRVARPIDAGGGGFFTPTNNEVIVVSGRSFADALGAATLGAELGAPVVVAGSASARAFLVANAAYVTRVFVVGGTKVVSEAEMADALSGAQGDATRPVVKATIAARAGATSISVLFDEAMAPRGTVTTNAGANQCATITEFSGTLANPSPGCYLGSKGKLIVIILTSALKSGDVIAVDRFVAGADGARAVIPASATVA